MTHKTHFNESEKELVNSGRTESENPDRLILFDGVCNLCNGWVNFVIDRDPERKFHFAALQSEAGQRVLLEMGLSADFLDSIVLVENGEYHLYSTSILRTLKRLNKLWPALYVLSVLPRKLRDGVYRWIASKRYSWFGRQDACRLPTPDVAGRFLK